MKYLAATTRHLTKASHSISVPQIYPRRKYKYKLIKSPNRKFVVLARQANAHFVLH